MTQTNVLNIHPENPEKYILKAKAAAQLAFYEQFGTMVQMQELYVCWFSKTLQNWKACVSLDTAAGVRQDGIYIEVTYNGDKGETYVDIYNKVRNFKFEDSLFGI